MSALKAFFLSRLLREKLLLVMFVGLGAAMWLSNFAGRAGRWWREQHAISVELADQKQWLANRQAIEAGAAQAVKAFDPERTLDDTKLVEELGTLAREQNLKFTNDAPQTERGTQFAIHTVQISLQTRGQDANAEWAGLKAFYVTLASRSPYMGIEQFSLSADRGNPARLNASVRVSSVEIVR